MPEDKDGLRKDLRQRRREFVVGHDVCQLRVHAIVMARLALEAAGNASRIACYLANPFEVDVMPIIQLACARGIETALPFIAEPDQPMRFLLWKPDDRLVTGPFAIPQPVKDAPEIEPDAIIAPLLGFDRAGNRLGQGGGFYDRAFAQHPAARRIGMAWSAQEQASLPVDSWDQRLHAIVTERERIDF